MSLRAAIGSFVTLVLLLLLNACAGSGPAGPTATIQGRVVDSTSTAPLDSAYAVRRDTGDSLRIDAAGRFIMEDMPPALYLFDVQSYGYHTHRHVAALVEPDDSLVTFDVPMLPQTLQLDCAGRQQRYHDDVQGFVESDSSAITFRLIDLYAEDGTVRVQPVIVNRVNAPLFLPDNFGTLDHYSVTLVDASGAPLRYRHETPTTSADTLRRIYEKSDVLVAVPRQTKRLEPSTLVLDNPPADGAALYARMQYDFSLDETLRPTAETDFPEETLDSLMTPVYDTLRVAGLVRTPDSLVVRRDTTVMEIVGADTTVTRDGYLLYNTRRPGNAAPTAERAVSLLYVPDSVKARTRLDSLIAAGVDTSAVDPDAEATVQPPQRDVRIVPRTDSLTLQRIFDDAFLAGALQFGLPRPGMELSALRRLSRDSLRARLTPPGLPYRMIYAPDIEDSLRTAVYDSMTVARREAVRRADSLRADSIRQALVERVRALRPDPRDASPDSLAPDSLAPDSLAPDSLAPDSLAPDTTQPPPRRPNAVLPDSLARLLPADSLTLDELARDSLVNRYALLPDTLAPLEERAQLTVDDSLRADSILVARSDSVIVDSTLAVDQSAPPAWTYWYAPESLTADSTLILVVDPALYRLRAPAALDTALLSENDLLDLIPERVGPPPERIVREIVQQIIAVPIGGYREKYLTRWKEAQQNNLRDHYCEIFRLPLQSPWRSTTMR